MNAETGNAAVRPAATVTLVRDGRGGLETLLLRRSTKVDFIADAWVFPGGAVDQKDVPRGCAADGQEAARCAAVREAQEEAGLVLPVEAMIPIAHWTGPRESPRRYATWFFLAGVDPGEAVKVDGGEIVHHRWYAPGEALRARQRQEISFLPPTYVTLLWLSTLPDVAAACAHFQSRAPQHFVPRLAFTDAGAYSLYQEDTAYEDGQLDRPGPRHRFWMGEEWKYEADF